MNVVSARVRLCVGRAAADTEECVNIHVQCENSHKHTYDTLAYYRAAVCPRVRGEGAGFAVGATLPFP